MENHKTPYWQRERPEVLHPGWYVGVKRNSKEYIFLGQFFVGLILEVADDDKTLKIWDLQKKRVKQIKKHDPYFDIIAYHSPSPVPDIFELIGFKKKKRVLD